MIARRIIAALAPGLFLGGAVLIAFPGPLMAQSTQRPAFTFKVPRAGVSIGTADPTGVYGFAGQALCEAWGPLLADQGGCHPEASSGSIENLDRLRSGRDQFVIAQSDLVAAAFRGDPRRQPPEAFAALRSLFSLEPEALTILVRQGVAADTIDTLKGARIELGKLGSGDEATALHVLQALGWTAADLAERATQDPSDAEAALCRGKSDALLAVIGHPNNRFYDLTQRCDVRLMGLAAGAVERLSASGGGYVAATIPGGLYRANPDPVTTVGVVVAVLVTTEAEPEALVHDLVAATFAALDRLRRAHPALRGLDPKAMVRSGIVAPLHPGAARYYREAGLLP